jgi:Zn-dependent protease with chaperone function
VSWENPQVPHEVNVSREAPLAEFLRLAAGLALFLALISAALYLAGGWLARFIPFETERRWVGDRVVGIGIEPGPAQARVEPYLQSLVDRLARPMALAPEIELTVHYSELDVPNAFATLGGHIAVTSGLYRRMPSENALALVLAHEIAHVAARDPISALGGSASLALLVALASGQGDRLLGRVGPLVLSGYSRRAESRADALAVDALTALYGHAGGGAAVFEVLADYEHALGVDVPWFLSTHPADDARIERLRAAASGWDPEREPLVPIAVPDDAE